jgi:hypothetical protein
VLLFLSFLNLLLECNVSTDPKVNPIVQEYILPDLSSNRKGRIRQPEDIVTEADQILTMNNERFTVPEIIFRPDDIGKIWILAFDNLEKHFLIF